MIIHLYKHNTTPYRSDTAGFWAAVDETGRYQGQRYTLEEWQRHFHTQLRQGTHPHRCPDEMVKIKNHEEYSVYWLIN